MYFGVQVWKQIKEDYKLTLAKKPRGRPKKNRDISIEDVEARNKIEGEFDPVAYLNSRSLEVVEAIVRGSKAGNASSQKLWGQLTGKLVEKTENINVELSAGDYIKIREEAKRRASEVSGTTDGDRSLLPKPALLPKKIRKD